MTDIVITLKTSQQSILEMIDKIQASSYVYRRVKPGVRDLRDQLLGHLAKQNQKLFDDLRAVYADDRENLKILEFLQHDLKEVKIRYLVFFDEHTGEMGDVNGRKFPKDFYTFSRQVLDRFEVEEQYFFPLIEKAFPQTS